MSNLIRKYIIYPIKKAFGGIRKFRHRIQLQTEWRRRGKARSNYKLEKEARKQAVDYFKPYHNITTLFHAFYTEKTGKFYPNYIPDDLYYCYIDHYYNDWRTAPTIDNKCFYDKLFPTVLQPESVLKRINNIWFDNEGNILTVDEALNVLCSRELFAKYAECSEGGHGVFYIDSEEEAKAFLKRIENIKNDMIIQEPVRQHNELAKINPSSVNTVRVLSLLSEDGVKVYSSILRMGRNGSKVDNASSGGITCGISEEGKLKSVAYTNKGELFEVHPDTQVKFSECFVPSYSNIVETVMDIHKCVPHFRLVSWDFSVREDGEPVLIESNLRYGELDFHQLNNGPVFGDDTGKILGEVFGKV